MLWRTPSLPLHTPPALTCTTSRAAVAAGSRPSGPFAAASAVTADSNDLLEARGDLNPLSQRWQQPAWGQQQQQQQQQQHHQEAPLPLAPAPAGSLSPSGLPPLSAAGAALVFREDSLLSPAAAALHAQLVRGSSSVGSGVNDTMMLSLLREQLQAEPPPIPGSGGGSGAADMS
jgi:hypothetical protein